MSDGFIHGLSDLLNNMSSGDGARGDYIEELWVKAGESARIRFLTDGDEVITTFFHRVVTDKESGKVRESYCTSSVGQDCQNCVDQVPKSLRWHVWVYVYYRLLSQPQEGCEIIEQAGRVMYKQPVNKVMLLRRGVGKGQYLANKLQSLYQRYGTLLDRDYDWVRQGSTKDNTTYDLIPYDQANFTVAMKELPIPLTEVVRNYPFKPGKSSSAPAPTEATKTNEEPTQQGEVVKKEEKLEEQPTRTTSLLDKLYGKKQ